MKVSGSFAIIVMIMIAVLLFVPQAYGSNENVAHGYGFTLPLRDQGYEEILDYLERIKATNATWVRFDVDLSKIQASGPDEFNWKELDLLMDALNETGLKGIGIIDYTPQWARSDRCKDSDKCPPADFEQYAASVWMVVARYKQIEAWEVWNEPNLGEFWKPYPNATEYTAFLKAVSGAIRAANPNATVIVGGLSRGITEDGVISPADFMARIYAANGRNYSDAVGIHPYSFPVLPSDKRAGNGWNQIGELRAVMAKNGDGDKPIWITEFGAPTGGPGQCETTGLDWESTVGIDHGTEQFQAAMFADAIGLYRNMTAMGPLIIYTLRDPGNDPNEVGDYFGLQSYNGSYKVAYYDMKTLIAA